MMTKVKVNKAQLRLAFGIMISITALAVMIWFVDGKQVLSALKQVNLIWIAPVLVLMLVSLMTRAAAWRTILKNRVSFGKSFLILNAGYFVNTVLPFR
ncbi:MAG: hypothetical protein GQ562_10400, partial [Anaerolineales bacterium]|nr:hypothetical protein [Anaerolineales bacterium]